MPQTVKEKSEQIHKNANDRCASLRQVFPHRSISFTSQDSIISSWMRKKQQQLYRQNKPHNSKCTSDDSHANHTVCTYTPKNKK
jgi:hypothetical protein